MSYVDQGMTQGRVYAIVAVAILHALLAYAFVTGLAYRFVKSRGGGSQDLRRAGGAAAPARSRRRRRSRRSQPPPIVAPPPLVRMNTPPPPITTVPVRAAAGDHADRAAGAAGAAAAAAAAARSSRPRARANLASYVSDADYPASAIRAEEQGTTGFRLDRRPRRPGQPPAR